MASAEAAGSLANRLGATPAARAMLLLLAAGLNTLLFFRQTILAGFARVDADQWDGRLVTACLEHWRHVWLLEAHWRSPIYFHPTPGVLGYEADPGVVGAPFFVMEKIDGVIPTDRPSWATEGFIADAEPAQRRALWERTVRMMAELHRLPHERFLFLRTGRAKSGAGDCLDYWMRSLRWAEAAEEPVPLAHECEDWLLANAPSVTALSWGDSRLPNVISRDFTPVGLLDWDLVSLAGPQADLAWWILMDPPESRRLEGIGTHDELIDLWEEVMGMRATELRWYLVFGAYRMAAIFAKLFSMMVAQGHMTAEARRTQLACGNHVQLLSGLLDLTPPRGVTPRVPDLRLER